MKKILLIAGAGYAEIPLIEAAKKLDLFVITTGKNKDEIGHTYADQYIYGDYSDKKEMLAIVKQHHIDYILPGCNDFGLLAASHIHDELGIGIFDSLNISQILHHKDLFRSLCQRHHLSAPKAIALTKDVFFKTKFNLSKYLKDLCLPLIVKPIDLSSGMGITRVDHLSELKKAIDHAFELTRESQIIIEEYIEGDHYSASILIHNGGIIFDFFAKEYFDTEQFTVAGAFAVEDAPATTKRQLFNDINTMIEVLELQNGLLHIQFIVKDSTPYILELTRRSPGDLYLLLVNRSREVNYAELIIRSHCNMQVIIPHISQAKPVVRECISASQTGKLIKVEISQSTHYIPIEKYVLIKNVIKHIGKKVAIIFLEFQNFQELYKHIPKKRKEISKVIIQ